MQEPLKGISFNFALAVLPLDSDRASVPASIWQSFTEGDPLHKTASRALARPYPSPVPKLGVFTHLFFQFDQKSAAFIHDMDEK